MPRQTAGSSGSAFGFDLNWAPGSGWVVVASVLGTAVGAIPIATLGAFVIASVAEGAAATATVAGAAALFMTVMRISQQLRDWANPKGNQASPRSAESILKERTDEDFDPDSVHVAICGPAGSGKSSLVNALRGLSDDDENAAGTGVDETTQERGKYLAHSSFYPLVLYDFPGAGTIQHPCMGYYESNKLYLYSLLLITYGERLGEAEISIIKECVRQNQPFILVRSRSDELIRRLNGRRKDKGDRARHELIQSTVKTFKSQLELFGVPSKVIEELMTYCLIVNRDDLALLAKTPKSQWPRESSTGEMQERQLLTLLGKRVRDEAATSH